MTVYETIEIKKRSSIIPIKMENRSSTPVVTTQIDNWVTDTADQMITSSGATLVFNSVVSEVAYLTEIPLKKRNSIIVVKARH